MPVLTRHRLPGDLLDAHARYIEVAVQGVLIACLYLPNGNPRPGPKLSYKLSWFGRLIEHAAASQATGLPVALFGDYNVVSTDAASLDTDAAPSGRGPADRSAIV